MSGLAGRNMIIFMLLGVLLGLAPAPEAQAAPICQPANNVATRTVPWPQLALAPERLAGVSQGAGVTVAVVDSGVSAAAPALAGRVLRGVSEIGAGGANTDCAGHGTFVAGLIAGAKLRGSAFAGLAPRARIFPVRMLTDQAGGSRDVIPNLLAKAINDALDAGVDVIACVTPAPYGSAALRSAVARAARAHVLIVAPVQTARAQEGDVAEPAAYHSVLGVAGVSRGGGTMVVKPSILPKLSAPAGGVISIPPHGRGTIIGSDASLAVGFVAGVAALVLERHPGLTPDELTRRLVATATPLASGAFPAEVGAGMVDPWGAVTAALPPANAKAPPKARRAPVRIELQPEPPGRRLGGVLLAIVGAAGLSVVVAFGAVTVRRGRRSARSARAAAGGT
jgi:subtilisin family serine protease